MKKLFTLLLVVAMTVAMSTTAFAAGHGGGGGQSPNPDDSNDSTSFEYYDITVITTGQHVYQRGTAGDHTWLVQGTYTYNFSFDGNTLSYRIGNQSGSLVVTMPDGYTVASYTPTVTWDDASVNSDSSQYDCAIVSISIDTMRTPDGEEIPYDPEPEVEPVSGSITVNYLDKDTGEVLHTPYVEVVDNVTEVGYVYDGTDQIIDIDNYTFSHYDGEISGMLFPDNPDEVINCYYERNKTYTTGTVTIYYLDKETGEEIADSYTYTDKIENPIPGEHDNGGNSKDYDVSDHVGIDIDEYTFDSSTGNGLGRWTCGYGVEEDVDHYIYCYYTQDVIELEDFELNHYFKIEDSEEDLQDPWTEIVEEGSSWKFDCEVPETITVGDKTYQLVTVTGDEIEGTNIDSDKERIAWYEEVVEEVPEAPEQPEEPSEPEGPSEPEQPNEPEQPEVPEDPKEPEQPEVAEPELPKENTPTADNNQKVVEGTTYKTSSPKTGDESNVIACLATLLTSGAGVIVSGKRKKFFK